MVQMIARKIYASFLRTVYGEYIRKIIAIQRQLQSLMLNSRKTVVTNTNCPGEGTLHWMRTADVICNTIKHTCTHMNSTVDR